MRRIMLVLLFSAIAMAASAKPVQVNGHTYHTGLIQRAPDKDAIFKSGFAAYKLPAAYDARDYGLVTRTKDQGACGSCWAHARVKASEAQMLKAGKKGVDLAEADLMANDTESQGCDGGFMSGKFEVKQGVAAEASCPYQPRAVACKGPKVMQASRWGFIGARDRAPALEELKAAIVEHGVIPVTVAACNAFAPGKDGRITTCSCKEINHMVDLVGYRTRSDGTTEFRMENSWGTGWGDHGGAWIRQGCNKIAATPGGAMFLAM